MKRSILFTFFVLSAVICHAQSQKSILNSIGKGDIAAVTKYLAQDVELCFFDNHDLYSKSEATTQLNEFFARHKAQGIRIKHEGDNKSGSSSYSIAELSTPDGPLRVFLYTDGEGANLEIQEMRFTRP